jgi:tRNA (Thr-GGU) A37 N-methylase
MIMDGNLMLMGMMEEEVQEEQEEEVLKKEERLGKGMGDVKVMGKELLEGLKDLVEEDKIKIIIVMENV